MLKPEPNKSACGSEWYTRTPMASLFTPEFFENNRINLRQKLGRSEPIILSAYGLQQKGLDEHHPFKQEGNFWYLSGITIPDAVLVITQSSEFVILPKQSEYQIDFHGQFDYGLINKQSGIDNIYAYEEGWQKLELLIKKSKSIASFPEIPEFIDVYGFHTNPSRNLLLKRLKTVNQKLKITDIRKLLGQLRMIKQPVEIEAISRAIDITAETIEDVIKNLAKKKYKFEYEIEADISHGFRRRGAGGHAFTPIIASGKNAAIIHNTENSDAIKKNELLLLDIGVEYELYAADISRTIAIDAPSERQLQIYNAVKEVQDFAFSIIKPGAMRLELEKKVRNKVGEKLIELGLIKTLDSEQINKYYPHSFSHFLGYDVHDFGDYDKPLIENVVITVEPGIYILEENIGVRIEDDILITKTGIEILSEKIPRSL